MFWDTRGVHWDVSPRYSPSWKTKIQMRECQEHAAVQANHYFGSVAYGAERAIT